LKLMTITRINASHLAQVEDLWQRSRLLYQNIGHEDLPVLLNKQIALLAEEHGRAWGFFCLQAEKRPPTLPAAAPNRAYIRAVAIARGRDARVEVPRLMSAVTAYLPAYAPTHLVTVYGDHDWLNAALRRADFAVAEEVQFLALDRLQRWQPPRRAHYGGTALPYQLRPCTVDDLAPLAVLDAAAFTPLWHFGQEGLHELLFTNRLQLLTIGEELIGYTAIARREGSAHLARLAVHPRWQGMGLSHLLLRDALLDAQRHGVQTVMLNTQIHNGRAQQLYRTYGFRPTGQVVPVLARVVGVDAQTNRENRGEDWRG
jgi:ribosomal-protein-alanine N-acetyltransferase